MWQWIRQLLQICGWNMDHADLNADTSSRTPLITDASSSSAVKPPVFSVTILLPLEKRRAKLQREIIELDRRADEIFTSLSYHISFVIVCNGAGVILRNISCRTVACMMTPTLLIPLVIGIALAISMTYGLIGEVPLYLEASAPTGDG
ncbi:hypothetical protein A4A49_32443 [Nicotiana attenuata]|uniref:Uncharacterized protein n=1 Tax=Nicotiana attenuata TaxID=49451 RepID=A0A1J6JXY6_NICAT|nr:hypothetical protein A4A49_32443 [Nicotiana attenuata]